MKQYWTLRPYDFRPERVKDLNKMNYPNEKIAIEQLSLAGNLFGCEDEAVEASIAIRAELHRLQFIRQERQASDRQSGKYSDND